MSNITRYLIIPLKRGNIFDDECKAALILAPSEDRARKHIKDNISKKFTTWEIVPIETNYDYSGR